MKIPIKLIDERYVYWNKVRSFHETIRWLENRTYNTNIVY